MFSIKFLSLLALFCLLSPIVHGQKQKSEELLNEIQTKISAGYLTSAKELVDELQVKNPNSDSFHHKMGVLLRARISGLEGNYKDMIKQLNKVGYDDESSVIQFYWKYYFSKYCLESNRSKMGISSLQSSIELASEIRSNTRVDIQKIISELYLIYYAEDIERRLDNREQVTHRIAELFDSLEEYEPQMQPFEKHFYYSYQLFFTDPYDTAAVRKISQKNIKFGEEYDQPVSIIIGKMQLAEYEKERDFHAAERYLLEAEKTSRSIQNLLYRLVPRYELMVYYKERKEFEKAIDWGEQARFPEGTDFSTYLDVYGQLSECYEAIGDIDNALECMKLDNAKFRSISRSQDIDMEEYYINQQKETIKEKQQVITKNRWFIALLISTSLVILLLWYKNKRIKDELFLKKESLERSLLKIENFSHILSHDLRAPIYSIRNLTETILEEDVHLSEDARDSLELICQCSSNSIALITNIMVYIRSKNVEMDSEEVNCHDLFSAVQNNLFYDIEHNQAKIIIAEDFPETMTGNKILLTQLFQNLIQNSLKYKRDDVPPIIQVSCVKNDGFDEVLVTDNGMGLRPEKLERLVDAFAQSEFVSIERGIGLGLSICRSIMKTHNGEVKLNSEYGKSTTVRLIFPSGTF